MEKNTDCNISRKTRLQVHFLQSQKGFRANYPKKRKKSEIQFTFSYNSALASS